jgi:hypothetical protein
MPKKQSKNKVRQNNQRKSKGRKMSSRRGNSKNKKNRTKLSYRKRRIRGGSSKVVPPDPRDDSATPEYWKQYLETKNQDRWINFIENKYGKGSNGGPWPYQRKKHIIFHFGEKLQIALDNNYDEYTLEELEGILQTINKIKALEGVSKDEELNTILDCAITKIKNVETTAKLAETEAELEKTKAELEKTKAPQERSDWQRRKSGWR